jgi:methionine-rich copper-binding protein CopC
MRNLLVLTLLVLAVAAFATNDMRHLKLTKSDPAKDATLEAAPAEIRLWFNQDIRLKVSSITLTQGEQGIALPKLEATDDAKSFSVALADSLDLGDGTYNVEWATAGDDEHVVKGTFSYTVSGSSK